MNQKLFIPVLLGTNREGRQSEKVAKFIISEINERADINTELIDVRNFRFTSNNYGGDFPDYKKTISRADGIIIVTPEYNHGYPGVLKETLDILFDEYKNKAVGIVSVSVGAWGGVRVIENLLPVLRELGLIVGQRDIQFTNIRDQFDENGMIKDEAYHRRTKTFLDELVWLGSSLRWGRENIS